MHKVVQWSFCAIVLLVSCSPRFDDSTLIQFDFKIVKDIPALDLTGIEKEEEISFTRTRNYIRDSLVFSFPEVSSSSVVSVSDSRTNSLIEVFCPKGRNGDEPLEVIPLLDFFEEEGSDKALFFSYSNSRLFKWNVTKSLNERKTIYDKVITINPEKEGGFLPMASCYRLSDEEIVFYNTHQTGRDWMEEPGTYEVYDADSGNLKKYFSPFSLFVGDEIKGVDGIFSSSVYLSLEDCVKPSRDKLAFGMLYMPYIGVLDLKSGTCAGVRIAKYPGLNPRHRHYHFMDLECDEEYVYALYCGKTDDDYQQPFCSEIFIFDWDCSFVGKIKVWGVHRMCLDRDVLYLLNYTTGQAYSLDSDIIKASIQQMG